MLIERKTLENDPLLISQGNMNLIFSLRRLWSDLAVWNRSYLWSVMSGYGNAMLIGQKLYTIPLDFYNRLVLVFGEQKSEGFVNLLSKHTMLMMTIITAFKNRDNQTINKNVVELYKNLSEIADYLQKMNPLWDSAQWNNLLNLYVRFTLAEITAFVSQQFDQDINIVDRLVNITFLLGDYMASGIMKYLTGLQMKR